MVWIKKEDNKRSKKRSKWVIFLLVKNDNASETTYTVFVVWKFNGGKEWFTSITDENTSLQIQAKSFKTYRLGLCEVDFDEILGTIS